MKVPVMFEAYRQAAAGRLDLDAPLVLQNAFASIADGSAYALDRAEDGDPALYDDVGRTTTLRALIARMIARSSNLATNIVIAKVGAEAVQRTVEELGTRDLKVLRGVEDQKAYDRGLNNLTTAHDLMLVMEAVARGHLVPPAAAREMLEVLRAQEFNEMIPAGLPEAVRPHVAHKTGQITAIHHDAAIVRPPGREGFVLVILTRGFETHAASATAGAGIAAAVWRRYAGGRAW
jgi:beta-lactamase class A